MGKNTELKNSKNSLLENARFLREIFNNAPVGFFRSTAEGQFVEVNTALAEMLGYASPDELMNAVNRTGIAESIFVVPESRAEIVRAVLAQGDRWLKREVAYYRKDRTKLHTNLMMHAVMNGSGSVSHLEGMVEDISERKNAEEALHRSEERYRSLVEMSSDWIWEVDATGRYTYASPVVTSLLGYTPEEVLGKTPFDFMTADEAERIGPLFQKIIASRKPFQRLCNHNIRKDGKEVVLETSGIPVFDDTGAFSGFRGIDRDATEQHHIERMLKKQCDKLQLYLDVAGVIFLVIDTSGCVKLINRKGCEVIGGADSEILGRNWFDHFVPRKLRKDIKRVFQRLIAGEVEPLEYIESWLERIDGEKRLIAWHNTLLRDAEGRITATLSSGLDITQQRATERAFKTERRRLFALLESLPAWVVLIDSDRNIRYANSNFSKDFEANPHALCSYALPCTATAASDCPVQAVLDHRRPMEWEKETRDGRVYQVYAYPFMDVNGDCMVLELGLDNTRRRMLEREAINTNRLVSLGELAAGVAHEINNPINGIINYAQLLAEDYGLEGEPVDISERIIKEGERIASIVGNLLMFARQTPEAGEPMQVAPIITEGLQLIQAGLRKDNIKLFVDIPDTLPSVLASPQKFKQVIINLVSNAGHALNRKYAGPSPDKRIHISARAVEADRVRLTFHDRGIGIPSNTIKRICDPFFTTKPPGEGTGLGLSISYGIIREFGGTLAFSSVEGEYTEAVIELPAFTPPRL